MPDDLATIETLAAEYGCSVEWLAKRAALAGVLLRIGRRRVVRRGKLPTLEAEMAVEPPAATGTGKRKGGYVPQNLVPRNPRPKAKATSAR